MTVHCEWIDRFHLIRIAGCCAVLVAWGCGDSDSDNSSSSKSDKPPVFRVDISHPTADKPQSKLWYARDRWWTWLPTTTGSSIWQRDADGWKRDRSLNQPLTGLTGRADVWADGDSARAVLVASDRLVVVALKFDSGRNSYRLDGEPVIWPLEVHSSVETATITRDRTGRWWVSYDQDRTMWVRSFRAGFSEAGSVASTWSEPIAVSDLVGTDDIATIVTMPDAVGLFWSDQIIDAFLFRRHMNGKQPNDWEAVEVVQTGAGTVNDHLNAAARADGTLFVATKTGSKRLGRPQLSLHIRHPNGNWQSLPYGPLTATAEYGRPIVLLDANRSRLFLCHSIYSRRHDGSRTSRISCIVVNTEQMDLGQPEVELVTAAANNATGLKAPLPTDAIPIVLASDEEGNIYEARLDWNERLGE
jgi:hypothetical protein